MLFHMYNLTLIILFFVKDDYKVAHKKANKAKNTNDLSSHNEDLRRKCKSKIKKKEIYRKKSSDSESSEIEISDTDDSTTYPNIPTNHTELRNSK